MEVSQNGGFPQHRVFLLKMINLGCFGGTTIQGNTHIIDSLVLAPKIPDLDLRNHKAMISHQRSLSPNLCWSRDSKQTVVQRWV